MFVTAQRLIDCRAIFINKVNWITVHQYLYVICSNFFRIKKNNIQVLVIKKEKKKQISGAPLVHF